LHAREHRAVDRLGVLFAAQDEARARTRQRLVRRRCDEVAMLDGVRVQPGGDDTFSPTPAIITTAIADGIANAALIKLNQIGTVSETIEAMAVCHRAGYAQMVSHRSGETPDPFIADMAVGTGCGQLKTGAPARGERVAKYNRLIEISAHHPDLPYGRG